MKKHLLSMVALATMGLAAMAQTYSVEPAANTVLPKTYSNWASMSFTFNFDQAVTVGDATSVKLMKDDPATGTEIAPDDQWNATTSNGGKTVTLWGADYDGFTCSFACATLRSASRRSSSRAVLTCASCRCPASARRASRSCAKSSSRNWRARSSTFEGSTSMSSPQRGHLICAMKPPTTATTSPKEDTPLSRHKYVR